MPTVKFIKEKKEIEVPAGSTLRNVAYQAGVNTNFILNGLEGGLNRIANCHGFGMCGTCRVLIKSGMENTNAMTLREAVKFKTPVGPDPIPCMAFIGHESEMRLACCTKINGDIEVETNPEFNLFGENFFS